ncbi:MAG: N-acetylglutaminylglutamine amidotransferase, partial [Pseudolabrys sp.]
GAAASPRAVSSMMDAMAPRGPDGAGLWANGATALGHRRLKIIDLSDRAQQPMVDPDLGLAVAFNGCIYNYKSLKAELEGKGYRFFSNGDTEVVLKAWHAWGKDAPKRFHGMFAFAIEERDTGRLALVRDRLGIKPLYYCEQAGKHIRFASTLPALLAAGKVDTSIDPVALNYYMTFHAVVPPPHTILKGVRKVEPATLTIFEPDGCRSTERFWSLSFARSAEAAQRSTAAWREALHAALRTAVERRMVADVPVGVLLSGGLDSSLIVGLLAEGGQRGLKTFSIGFESVAGEQGDEFHYSDLIAKRYDTEHHKLFIESDKLIASLPETILAMSEPMVSYDNVGFYLLSKEVARHVKVVQSGQGADEVFAGYHWYPPLLNSNDPVGDYAAHFFDRDRAEYARIMQPAYVDGDHARDFVCAHFDRAGADDAVDKALRLDTTVMLVDDPVKRVDNMTMSWGLEARVPFLDHDLVELAAQIPAAEKVRDEGKGILKDVAREIIPSEVIDRPKGYFPVPALKYIEGPVLDFVRQALDAPAARQRGLVKREYIDTLLQAPKEHITRLRGSKLWQIALLELWLQAHHI